MHNQQPGKDKPRQPKLWNGTFTLLWQGLMVSNLGDLIYFVALGFWVYEKTGSSAVMGSLMGVSALTGVLVSPVAGVMADRFSRKKLIVGMDIARGLVILVISILALMNRLEIWMVVVAGVLTKAFAAFFDPAVNAAVPDLVRPERLTSGFSAINSGRAAVNMIGNPIAGSLYGTVGAPIMFLINAIAYLLSAVTELFIPIPKMHVKEGQRPHYADPLKQMGADLKQAALFIYRLKGFGAIMLCALVCLFFANMCFTLMIPFFHQTMDAKAYGIAIAALSAGAGVGALITTFVKIPYKIRPMLVVLSGVSASVLYALFAFVPFPMMLVMLFLGGLGFTIVQVLATVTIQQTTPAHLRGKVNASVNAGTIGLVPIAAVLGGVLGDTLPISYVFLACMSLVGLILLLMSRNKDAMAILRFNPETQDIGALMGGSLWREPKNPEKG